MKKYLFIFGGTLSLLLGIIGIVLPVLPTTPFLLLSAWLYYRSSPKLYQRLIESPHFGPYIKAFQEDHSIPLRIKIYSISLLWITILLSAFVFIHLLWLRILLIGIAMGVTIHILSYPTKK